jgi:hypothetical protein
LEAFMAGVEQEVAANRPNSRAGGGAGGGGADDARFENEADHVADYMEVRV